MYEVEKQIRESHLLKHVNSYKANWTELNIGEDKYTLSSVKCNVHMKNIFIDTDL